MRTPKTQWAHAALGFCLLALLPGETLSAQSAGELGRMSLEELMNVEVTTALRTPEIAAMVPAAVFVITAEEIERSGATSLAEVLRLAPGLQVARVDAGKWSIGARGFADRLARSMLVLIDGRAVYSPLFAGTYWETQDVLLEDVERIEVVLGPGGTLWGSNAVNGIISVVTKAAQETQGLLLTGGVGDEDRWQGGVRYGTALGGFGHARGYLKGFEVEPQHPTGDLEYDGWRVLQGGFRADGALGLDNSLTLQGDLYHARLGEFVRETSLVAPFETIAPRDLPLGGGSLLARLSRPLGTRASLQLQSYYDFTDREEYPVSEDRRTLDLDLQVRHYAGSRHELLWGLGYRLTSGEISTAPTSELPSGSESLYSVFLQDEISLASGDVRVVVGTKLEHNPYSGLEVQPSARLVWHATRSSSLWSSVTRAVRRPSRVERQYATTSVLNAARPAFVRLEPNPDFSPEQLLAYEIGYRVRPTGWLYASASAFYNDWADLLSTELVSSPITETPPNQPERLVYPVAFRNGLDGRSYGIETQVDVRPMNRWRIAAQHSFLRVLAEPKPGAADLTQESRYEEGSPRHQLRIHNSFDLTPALTLDWHLRHVGELPDMDIPAYTTSDVRVAWRVTDALRLEAVGRNLHTRQHAEWPGENGGANVEIERSFYVGASLRR